MVKINWYDTRYVLPNIDNVNIVIVRGSIDGEGAFASLKVLNGIIVATIDSGNLTTLQEPLKNFIQWSPCIEEWMKLNGKKYVNIITRSEVKNCF